MTEKSWVGTFDLLLRLHNDESLTILLWKSETQKGPTWQVGDSDNAQNEHLAGLCMAYSMACYAVVTNRQRLS